MAPATTTVGSLCSGYTGLEMGVSLIESAETAWHAEISPAACKVLAHHYPDTPNLGDINAVDWSTVEPVDLLCAGYPCQPFSLAGVRKGTDDDRHVWPAVAAAIRVLRPRRVLLENVAGHLSLGFGAVHGDLASLGYDTRWTCLRAADVGAPHRRDRLFVLATDTRSGPMGPEPLTEPRSGRAVVAGFHRASPADAHGQRLEGWPQPNRRPTDTAETDDPSRRADPHRLVSAASHADHTRQQGTQPAGRHDVPCWGGYGPAIQRWESLTRPAPPPLVERDEPFRRRTGRSSRVLSPAFVEWMMGLPAGWVTDVDIPRTAQLRVLGAGVVPQQAAAAWSMLAEARVAA